MDRKVRRIWVEFEDGSRDILDVDAVYRTYSNCSYKRGTGQVDKQWTGHVIQWEVPVTVAADSKSIAVLDAEDAKKMKGAVG